MLNPLVLTLASSHSGALASLIGQIPSLKCENVAGNLAAVILSIPCLSVVSTLRTVQIGLVVLTWLGFHRNFFLLCFRFLIVILSIVALDMCVFYYISLSASYLVSVCFRSVG